LTNPRKSLISNISSESTDKTGLGGDRGKLQ
jgi:hypothetical protein